MRVALAAVTLIWVSACGYVGPIVPPSPRIPLAVSDLAAIERGDRIDITFSTPPRTLDALPIEEFSRVELRVGPAPEPFDLNRWQQTARPYPLPHQYVGSDPEDGPRSLPVEKQIPVADWQGQTVAISVRTAVKARGNDSAWAKPVILHVTEPVPPPQVNVEATAGGYRLQWTSPLPATRYRILRQDPGAQKPDVIGFSDSSQYLDGTAHWDTRYQYSVIAERQGAESLPSRPQAVTHADTFPPAVPANVIALAGPDSIELTWTRNTEPDLKGYLVFRSENGGAFQRMGDLQTLPAYSDRSVRHGVTYRYAVSSVDQKNNTSENSPPAETTY